MHLVLIQLVPFAIFTSLQGLAGACIPPLQCMYFQYNMYLSIVVHTDIITILLLLYVYPCDPKQTLCPPAGV